MKIINSPKLLQNEVRRLKQRGKSVGFVPTMGALHKGHLSLVDKARRENDIVILSIFVNPTQFGPKEDFSKYPRDFKKDSLFARQRKVDIIFHPSGKYMYPRSFLTSVNVHQLSEVLCGRSRPTHFSGVATVVLKLLNIAQPDRLYLGQKDAQQAVIIKKMAEDLNVPVRIKVCRIIREKDGLALSSRNKYLTEKQRNEASVIYRSLKEVQSLVKGKRTNASKIKSVIHNRIRKESSGNIEYIACVDADTLKPIHIVKGHILIALAVRFGSTRLIDNIRVHVK